MGTCKMAMRAVSRAAAPVLRRGFATEAAASAKLNFSLTLPSAALYDNTEVDLVVVPATNGAFGIMKDHVPTVAQLDAGLLTVHSADGEDKYFVSGGFAIVKEDRADVCCVEAVRVEDLDSSEVSKGLSEAQGKLASANDDLSRAEAQITVATYMAMQSAIDAK